MVKSGYKFMLYWSSSSKSISVYPYALYSLCEFQILQACIKECVCEEELYLVFLVQVLKYLIINAVIKA